jgi:hypothetical protein
MYVNIGYKATLPESYTATKLHCHKATNPGTKLHTQVQNYTPGTKLGTQPDTKLGRQPDTKLGTQPDTKLGTQPDTKL